MVIFSVGPSNCEFKQPVVRLDCKLESFTYLLLTLRACASRLNLPLFFAGETANTFLLWLGLGSPTPPWVSSLEDSSPLSLIAVSSSQEGALRFLPFLGDFTAILSSPFFSTRWFSRLISPDGMQTSVRFSFCEDSAIAPSSGISS